MAPVLEAFIFDFEGDLYGQTIEVEFIDYVRGDAKFEGADALKKQMDRAENAPTILQQNR